MTIGPRLINPNYGSENSLLMMVWVWELITYNGMGLGTHYLQWNGSGNSLLTMEWSGNSLFIMEWVWELITWYGKFWEE